MAKRKSSTSSFPGRGRRLKKDECESVFEVLSEHIDPRAELNWETPMDLLVAVVLSAQATDRSVNKVTATLWQHCREPEDYVAMGEEDLADAIRSIGLFRNKAKAIVGLSRELIERFDGSVPDRREDLESLPGVGRKSANVVLNVAFREPVIAVDTHVFRVSNRVGLVKADTPRQVEDQLMERTPERFLVDAHHYLILHGRYTCTAKKPQCPECPLRDFCTFRRKTTSEENDL